MSEFAQETDEPVPEPNQRGGETDHGGGAYIPSEEFLTLSYEEATIYRGSVPMFADEEDGDGQISEYPLLSPEGEAFLFRKMNYLKHLASELSRKKELTPTEQEDLQAHQEDAQAVRELISRCCYRLSRSIARNLATNRSDFDEMFGEANLVLLKAIDKFNYSKGFRFSTYATHSIQRHLYRWIERKRKRSMLSHSEHESFLTEVASEDPEYQEKTISTDVAARQILDRLGECLDEREQSIIRQRFQLEGDESPKTLGDLAEEWQISSERVRQIQAGALKKLEKFFGEIDIDMLSL